MINNSIFVILLHDNNYDNYSNFNVFTRTAIPQHLSASLPYSVIGINLIFCSFSYSSLPPTKSAVWAKWDISPGAGHRSRYWGQWQGDLYFEIGQRKGQVPDGSRYGNCLCSKEPRGRYGI